MASIIRIKRSTTSGNPTTLGAGELAYSGLTDNGSNGGDRLYIGMGTETAGDAANHYVIGGKYFTDRLDHTAGTLTASSAIVVDSNKKIDDLLVDNLQINGNTISSTDTNGNINITPNGSGSVVLDGLSYPQADGTAGQFLKTDGSGNLTFGTVTQSLSIAADSGSNDSVSTGETITFTGGEGIDTTVSDNTITIAAEDATTSNKGIASFDTNDFGVTSGAVSLNDAVVKSVTGDSGTATPSGHAFSITGDTGITTTASGSAVSIDLDDTAVSAGSYGSATAIPTFTVDAQGRLTAASTASISTSLTVGADSGSDDTVALGTDTLTIAGGANITTTVSDNQVSVALDTDLNSLTSVDVDNITLDGNTISTTNSNGDLVLSPNGTGSVTVPSGYESRAGFGDDSVVNKAYVDSVANGLDVKASVRGATTADLSATYDNGAGTLTADSNGALSVDGISDWSTDERILVKDQTNAEENGFYKVTTVGDAGSAFVLTRTPDADAASELTGGAFTFVEEGTANADNGYVMTQNGDITLGTTEITFDQFSGAGQISAGAGLTKTGNTIDAVGTSNRISVTANAIDIASTYVGQSSITTLGTIGTGVWNGTSIADAYIDNDLTISGGTVDNTVIGGSTAAAGSFTALDASTSLSISATTDSSSTSTGSIVTSGGMGIAKTLYVGVNVTGAGASTSTLDGFNIDGGTY